MNSFPRLIPATLGRALTTLHGVPLRRFRSRRCSLFRCPTVGPVAGLRLSRLEHRPLRSKQTPYLPPCLWPRQPRSTGAHRGALGGARTRFHHHSQDYPRRPSRRTHPENARGNQRRRLLDEKGAPGGCLLPKPVVAFTISCAGWRFGLGLVCSFCSRLRRHGKQTVNNGTNPWLKIGADRPA